MLRELFEENSSQELEPSTEQVTEFLRQAGNPSAAYLIEEPEEEVYMEVEQDDGSIHYRGSCGEVHFDSMVETDSAAAGYLYSEDLL